MKKSIGMDLPLILGTACLFMAVISVCSTSSALSKEARVQLMDAHCLCARYVKALKANLSWVPGEMEIINVRVNPRKIWLPEGRVSFKIEDPPAGAVVGKVSSMVTILVDGQPFRHARVSARIEVYKPVLCAVRGLKRGQIIRPGDLKQVTMPLSRLKAGYFQQEKAVLGLAARRSLRPGQIVTSDVLTKPAVVKRGSRVMIVAQCPGIIVRVPGEVEEKGAIGDFVRVKNISSRKVIIAQVHDSRTVKVNF